MTRIDRLAAACGPCVASRILPTTTSTASTLSSSPTPTTTASPPANGSHSPSPAHRDRSQSNLDPFQSRGMQYMLQKAWARAHTLQVGWDS